MLFKVKYLCAVIASVTLLASCKGTDSELPFNNTESQIITYNGFLASKVGNQVSVDITSYIKSDDIAVKSIIAENSAECFNQILDLTKITLNSNEAGRCHYTITAENSQQQQAQTSLTLISTKNIEPNLPIISLALEQQVTNVSDVKDLVGSIVISDGYAITDFTVQSELGSAKPTIAATGTEFTFIAPSMGWHNIQYLLEDTNGGEPMLGEFFISVGDKINSPPSINPQTATYPKIVNRGETVAVNLEDLQLAEKKLEISDDSGIWQLSNLKAINAEVSPSDPHDPFNKKFSFTSNKTGNYDVAYIISDHQGASTLGLLRFLVKSPAWVGFSLCREKEGIADKDYYYCQYGHDPQDVLISFTAPLTYAEALKEVGNTEYHVDLVDGENYQVAMWSPTSAEQYCASKNMRLPNSNELQMLHELHHEGSHFGNLPPGEVGYWPLQKEYYYQSHDGKIDLKVFANDVEPVLNTHTKEAAPEDRGYVTCVYDKPRTLSLFLPEDAGLGQPQSPYANLKLQAGTSIDVTAQINFVEGSDADTTLAEEEIESVFTDPNPLGLLCEINGSNAKTDNLGKAICKFEQTTAGVYTIMAKIKGDQDIQGTNVIEVVANSALLNLDIAPVPTKFTKNDDQQNIFSVAISQQDIYGNFAKGFKAEILTEDQDNSWLIDNQSQSMTYLSTGDRVLDIKIGTSQQACLKVTSLVNPELINYISIGENSQHCMFYQ